MARGYHSHGIWLGESGQVEEVGVLTKVMRHIVISDLLHSCGNDCDAFLADRLGQTLAAGLETG
jgi:hypothetical protein